MHSFNTTTTTFQHNGDYSGNVVIITNPMANDLATRTLVVPFSDLKAFIAAYVRSERIVRLERADDDAALGLPEKVS